VSQDVGTGYSHYDFGTPINLQPGDPDQPSRLGDLYEFVDATPSSIANCEIVQRIGEHATVVPAGPVTMAAVGALLTTGHTDAVVGLFSPVEFAGVVDPSGKSFPLQIVNMMSIRITGLVGTEIHGVITGGIGDLIDGGGQWPRGKGSMIKKVHLVR
jgi:hypothetical protein